ncbi:uncharacterized protein V1518DRAFT_403611 [Limtongia smithiae]|uniref:uncharacterized protein n=1 Tax=Limtongia smithiae TaxID=1125753 RepID=UPI0034CFEF3A
MESCDYSDLASAAFLSLGTAAFFDDALLKPRSADSFTLPGALLPPAWACDLALSPAPFADDDLAAYAPSAPPSPARYPDSPVLAPAADSPDTPATVDSPYAPLDTPQPFQHVLSPRGEVLFAAHTVERVLGYAQQEFTGKFLRSFVAPADCDAVVAELMRAADAADAAVHIFCSYLRKDGELVRVELSGSAHFAAAAPTPNYALSSSSAVPSRTLKCFVLNARPHSPSTPRPAAPLALPFDSFLDNRFEHLLVKQIVDAAPPSAAVYPADPPTPASASSASTSPAAFPFADASHIRRHSAGDVLQRRHSPSLLPLPSSSAAVAPAQPPRHPRAHHASISEPSARPTKKQKTSADEKEYKCSECGTLDSPEWRKGPQGPKTLCNACGLRWSKSLKKRLAIQK